MDVCTQLLVLSGVLTIIEKKGGGCMVRMCLGGSALPCPGPDVGG